ncbi:MAG TPA: AlkA N-terminal domain-containing protein [Verrucomicrobiae bacterium]|nr:AlkA N-terminal domain-containing protein [Verrucomicrobiae bacterium]
MELPAHQVCYRVLESRDARFDGLLFVGVSSTGVYCRPICPARTPKFKHCRFFPSAAAAQEAGFRPCLRCRPEIAPDFASWRGTANTVSRALIAEGALDGRGSNVEMLAARVGVGERQLRRLFLRHLGASPISVAQTRRVLFAKQLIHDTRMSMADVARASGFGNLRRFNEVFRGLFHLPPGALRRKKSNETGEKGIELRLSYRPPYDWDAILNFLETRAIPGVEIVKDGCYLRTIELNGASGSIAVTHVSQKQCLEFNILFPKVEALPVIVARLRRLFDLGADIETINRHLSADPALAPLVSKSPGLRAPGGWDGFEIAVRAVLGQQITVAAARRLAGRLVELHGRPVPKAFRLLPAVSIAFPDARRLASTSSLGLAMPASRISTLKRLSEAAVNNPNLFCSLGGIQRTLVALKSIRGVGEWTAQYIALRAVREPDAFPVTDLGLLRAAAAIHGARITPAALLKQAESWQPWRAYAAQHLWAAGAKQDEGHHAVYER